MGKMGVLMVLTLIISFEAHIDWPKSLSRSPLAFDVGASFKRRATCARVSDNNSTSSFVDTNRVYTTSGTSLHSPPSGIVQPIANANNCCREKKNIRGSYQLQRANTVRFWSARTLPHARKQNTARTSSPSPPRPADGIAWAASQANRRSFLLGRLLGAPSLASVSASPPAASWAAPMMRAAGCCLPGMMMRRRRSRRPLFRPRSSR